jgi:phosphatidylglycerophosphate synthase
MTALPMRTGSDAQIPEIDEPLNRWLIHPLARRLLPVAIGSGVSPNTLSLLGLLCGVLAAFAYTRWQDWPMATAGFLAMLAWHVFDGLDGMVARATGRTSAFGRFLDGVCDYAVFVMVYVVLAASVAPALGTALAYGIAGLAGAAHAVQSAYYEAQRELYVRRLAGEAGLAERTVAGGILEQLYNRGQAAMTRDAALTDAWLRTPVGDVGRYRVQLAPVMQAMTLLGPTVRTLAIFIACTGGTPILFWMFEIVVLLPALMLLESLRSRRESRLAL